VRRLAGPASQAPACRVVCESPTRIENRMADGRWQMADGRWQMANGRWQTSDAGCQMPDAGCQMPDARWQMPDAMCYVPFAICHLPCVICHMPDGKNRRETLDPGVCHLSFATCHLSSRTVQARGRRSTWQGELVTGLISPSAGGQSQPSRRGSRAAHEPKHPEKTNQDQEA